MTHRAFYLTVFVLLALASGAQAATTTYAATTLGLYKSTDGGATWQSIKISVTTSLLQGVPMIGAIAIDPLNPAVIHFLGGVSGTSGFFNSTDGGQTWSPVLLPGVGVGGTQPYYWLCIDPVATKNLYLSAGGSVGVPVLYAGPQGVQPGLDQFNVLIPPELATGGPQVVPIVPTAGGQTANTVFVTVQ